MSLVVLVAALVFGRDVIRWWHGGYEDQPARPVMIPGGPAGPESFRLIQCGSSPGALGRQPFQGNRKAALAALKGICREMVRSAPSPETPPSEEERRFLDRMASTLPAEQVPGQWRIYQLDVALPMVAAVRLDNPKRPGNRDTPVAATACRVVTWGMAVPVTENAWTLYVFSPRAPSIDGGGAKEIPIPPGSERLLSMQVVGGGRIISFKGRASPDSWRQFYDQWLSANDWRPHGPWRHSGSVWGLRCDSKSPPAGGIVDLELVENASGQSTGVLLLTPGAQISDGKQHP